MKKKTVGHSSNIKDPLNYSFSNFPEEVITWLKIRPKYCREKSFGASFLKCQWKEIKWSDDNKFNLTTVDYIDLHRWDIIIKNPESLPVDKKIPIKEFLRNYEWKFDHNYPVLSLKIDKEGKPTSMMDNIPLKEWVIENDTLLDVSAISKPDTIRVDNLSGRSHELIGTVTRVEEDSKGITYGVGPSINQVRKEYGFTPMTTTQEKLKTHFWYFSVIENCVYYFCFSNRLFNQGYGFRSVGDDYAWWEGKTYLSDVKDIEPADIGNVRSLFEKEIEKRGYVGSRFREMNVGCNRIRTCVKISSLVGEGLNQVNVNTPAEEWEGRSGIFSNPVIYINGIWAEILKEKPKSQSTLSEKVTLSETFPWRKDVGGDEIREGIFQWYILDKNGEIVCTVISEGIKEVNEKADEIVKLSKVRPLLDKLVKWKSGVTGSVDIYSIINEIEVLLK